MCRCVPHVQGLIDQGEMLESSWGMGGHNGPRSAFHPVSSSLDPNTGANAAKAAVSALAANAAAGGVGMDAGWPSAFSPPTANFRTIIQGLQASGGPVPGCSILGVPSIDQQPDQGAVRLNDNTSILMPLAPVSTHGRVQEAGAAQSLLPTRSCVFSTEHAGGGGGGGSQPHSLTPRSPAPQLLAQAVSAVAAGDLDHAQDLVASYFHHHAPSGANTESQCQLQGPSAPKESPVHATGTAAPSAPPPTLGRPSSRPSLGRMDRSPSLSPAGIPPAHHPASPAVNGALNVEAPIALKPSLGFPERWDEGGAIHLWRGAGGVQSATPPAPAHGSQGHKHPARPTYSAQSCVPAAQGAMRIFLGLGGAPAAMQRGAVGGHREQGLQQPGSAHEGVARGQGGPQGPCVQKSMSIPLLATRSSTSGENRKEGAFAGTPEEGLPLQGQPGWQWQAPSPAFQTPPPSQPQQSLAAANELPVLPDIKRVDDCKQEVVGGCLRVLSALSSASPLRVGLMHALCRMSNGDLLTTYLFLQVRACAPGAP